jgi:hypothetical protein
MDIRQGQQGVQLRLVEPGPAPSRPPRTVNRDHRQPRLRQQVVIQRLGIQPNDFVSMDTAAGIIATAWGERDLPMRFGDG